MEMIRWMIGGGLCFGAIICFSVGVKGLILGNVGSPAKHSSRAYARASQPDRFRTSISYYFFVGAFALYLAFEVFTFKLD
jgi:uncharacterized membrane protein